ncbi:Arc family DNA-binding protein [Acetobacter senegalensis]|uniref:Arc family DNA-binding protein n=1 Tax=Acetobacter senegalensis TaxID=446692 RepID=UPI00264D798F|nr:Arc family DNA-binding protein [Acetobacter senegalensis]MDN7356321.1 Arc family DNA-binding protein [Acetobacter senegalensis]
MVHIRIPQSIKDALEVNAKENCRSLNSEIVFGLKIYIRSIEQTEKASGQSPNRPDASHHHE